MSKSLFGIPVPDNAVKATIKPSIGRGQTKAMWSGAIERDGIVIEETDIIAEVADNAGFWSYLDLQVQSKRVTQKDPSVWSFKVLVSFEDQAGIKTEAACSSDEHEFYRRGSQAAANGDPLMARLLTVIVELPKALHEQTLIHQEKVTAASLKTIEETGKQAAAASAAIVQSSAEPLKADIDAINKALETERSRFDSSVKLNMRMLETKEQSNIFKDIGHLAPLLPVVKNLLN